MATRSPSRTTTVEPIRVALPSGGTYAWALLAGGRLEGSTNAARATGTIESAIKVWLAADFLRNHPQATARDRARLARMISYSDNAIAEQTYRSLGRDRSVVRANQLCGLKLGVVSGWWARTRVSASDLARLGRCVADGRAAASWTRWLLDVMRARHADGAFGVVAGVGTPVAYMNGWTWYPSGWQVNCLAIGPGWTLGIMSRYPAGRGLAHGAGVCASVARQLAAAGRI